ncbi:H-NS family nucleoid-associated regulatory protein [Paraburkholderia fungorum]|uniref:H-NS family nucleoid-associated regulatory protein n=1 Tax=Paraburkholderia fungorum TaxID=134537 RepID=UPI00402B15A7
MATLESLQAKIQKLQAQAEALATKRSSAVIEKIKNLMAQHGLTTADIDAHTGGRKRGRKPSTEVAVKSSGSAAKYRDPKTGATWSGRGRAPAWIVSAKDRSKFLVEANAVSSAPAAKKSATAGNYVRGPQPALYLDPKSGATWSGRGRAPAWIVDVKDRSKFLISRAAEGAVAATSGTVRKSKASVKKTASKSFGVSAGTGQRKGPQPAKYRDPKSGATWSGRGPAPTWLFGAKDRSNFLIDAAEVVGDAKPMVTKAVAKKAPTVKKTAAKRAVSAKAPAKKASAKKAPRESEAVPATLPTVEPSVELTA